MFRTVIREIRRFHSHLSKKTPLYNFHVENEGKMVDFAGWSLPSSYKLSVGESHLNVRKSCGLFDVSHMLKMFISGEDATKLLLYATVADVANMKVGNGSYTLLLNDDGGIYDDAILSRISPNEFYMVSNASRAENTIIEKKFNVHVNISENDGLLALQGPIAVNILENLTGKSFKNTLFMQNERIEFEGDNLIVCRCGYTGEDGFEIFVPNHLCENVANKLLDLGKGVLTLSGLTVRDSLRQEASLCLYGNDIDEKISPVSAGLMFTITKQRRSEGLFRGAKKVVEEHRVGPEFTRVGFLCHRRIPRKNQKIFLRKNGYVTSGCRSPVLNQNIGMGYVKSEHRKAQTDIYLSTVDNLFEAKLCKMPFVKTKYYINII